MKKCVVSFADENGVYRNKLKRLEQSLKGNFDGDFLAFTSYDQIGCEPHKVIPYKFKPYSIQKAVELGYELILWCDSPIYAKKSIQPVFNHIQQHGYVFFDNIGYSLGDYTNDKTLQYFQIPREESWNIKMIMACVMGFVIIKNDYPAMPLIPKFFTDYKDTADALYPGSWNNDNLTESHDLRCRGHRHDQSVMSALIYKNGLDILKGQDTFFAYESHQQVMPIANSVCLYSG